MFDSRWLSRATGCKKDLAYRHADWLVKSAERWGIDTPTRIAAWVAQLAHESAGFTRFEENLNYTTPARLISVWPTRFRLPLSDGEAAADRFLDGKRNARRYVEAPESLAEFVYGGRMGNGPEGYGDGWRYIGRGFIHLTGRENYRRYSQASGNDVETAPSMLIYPLYAADSAGWFWQAHGCSALADAGDWRGLTRRINGGLNGIDDRLRLTRLALDASGLA
jgi:putative chitinase